MSDYANIGLIGKSRESLKIDISEIKKWDNGHNYPIKVTAYGKYIHDSIRNVEAAIDGDLAYYLEINFGDARTILKSGGNDDLYFVPNPDCFNEDGLFVKIRHKPTNITPSKKKRKK